MATEKIITVKQMKIEHMIVRVEGTSDLVLNKMNERSRRLLESDDRKKIKEVPNKWEDIITAVHWRDPLPCKNTYEECTEEMLDYLLENNAPCITAFGLKKSWGSAVVQNEIDKYSTKFASAVNIPGNGQIPIKFAQWHLDERLMSPQRGAPINVRLNHFSGWSAEIPIEYTEHVFSREQIINIINIAGFCQGIGSGRTSGYGRYKVVGLK